MSELEIGDARVATNEQDLTAQHNALGAFGVEAERIYVDHGLTGTTRARPGLREAMAACRGGDTLVVTKLDRLACSAPEPATSLPNSPRVVSGYSLVHLSMTRPIRSAGARSCPKLHLNRFRELRWDGLSSTEREGRDVATTTVTTTTQAERERRVAEAIHSGEMEGLHVMPAGREDAREYIAGGIDSDELVARARARYGLD